MVGAILTQNTAWSNVEKAIANLKANKMLDLKALHALDHAQFATLIKPSGYFNIKAKRIKNLITLIMNHCSGKLDVFFAQDHAPLHHQLLSVNGIGKETADSICCYAAEKPVFVVDAYTRRILLRHAYIDESWDYDRIQTLFTSRLPANLQIYKDLHAYIVFVGKTFCKTRNPACDQCPAQESLTPLLPKETDELNPPCKFRGAQHPADTSSQRIHSMRFEG
jgi:endonuclease-3 related protein